MSSISTAYKGKEYREGDRPRHRLTHLERIGGALLLHSNILKSSKAFSCCAHLEVELRDY